jgi:hypothetical protein
MFNFYPGGIRGGLGSKSPCGNRFYKSHIDIAGIASHHFKKASISLKMYLKSLAILEKASISLKSLKKILEIFIKAPNFLTEAFVSLEMSSKSLHTKKIKTKNKPY